MSCCQKGTVMMRGHVMILANKWHIVLRPHDVLIPRRKFQHIRDSTMETSACWVNVVQHFSSIQILIYAVKDRCYPAMTPFWNITQCYRDKMSLTSRLWADLAQYPRVKLPLLCFSSPGVNLGCLSGPGITWCLQTGMIQVHFFKVYGISLQWWKDVWICHLIWVFASIEQPFYNGVYFVWWLRLFWIRVWVTRTGKSHWLVLHVLQPLLQTHSNISPADTSSHMLSAGDSGDTNHWCQVESPMEVETMAHLLSPPTASFLINPRAVQ